MIFAIFTGLLLPSYAVAQEANFSQREQSVIHHRALDILYVYEDIINQMGVAIVHNPSNTKGLREQFVELCINPEVTLFNDLDPSYNTSENFEVETYINTLELSYPDGISVDLHLDNVRVGDIIDHGDNIYTLDFQVDKQIQGNYRNRQFNTNLENLLIKIGFTETGNEFRNFKIVGIRRVGSEFSNNDELIIEELNSKRMSQSENEAIKQAIESLLNDYSNWLWLIGNKDETDYDKDQYARSFKALFESPDLHIYNDLVPNPDKQSVSLDEYLDILRIHYPVGINDLSITIDSIMFHNVIAEEAKVYRVNIDVDKFFSGEYENQELFRSMFPLTFKITFQKTGRVYGNYRIRSIEPVTADFIESNETSNLALEEIDPVSRKGIALEVFASYGQTRIEDHQILDMSTGEDISIWSYTPGHGINLGLGVLMSFTDHIALETGGFFNQYNTTFSTDGTYSDAYLSSDANEDIFYKKMEVNYDSTITYNLISVPLTFTYTSSNPGNTGIYLSVGGLFSYCQSGAYTTSGSWRYYGFYPNHPSYARELDIEELGFYTHENIEESGTLDGGQINLSVRASMGLSIPIKYFIQIRFGPEIEWGLYDFNVGGEEASDIFGNSVPHQPTYLLRFGFKLGVVVKL